mmetsp:Transcript_56242/g.144797  ORF Transcript_56242/g.144797 Transcript_56242/m.144797 type:complete len:556 (+) Transcript_56242:230-1897(+)
MLMEALLLAPKLLLQLRPLVGALLLQHPERQPQLVHLRGVLDGRSLAADAERVHLVLRRLGRALRLVELRDAPLAVVLAHARELLHAGLQVLALPLPLGELLLDRPLLVHDVLCRHLLRLHGLAHRRRRGPRAGPQLLEVLRSQRVAGLAEVHADDEVLAVHASLRGRVALERLDSAVHLPHQALDRLRAARLLHVQLPDVLLGLLAVRLHVLQHLAQVLPLPLQALDVLLGVGLAVDLLRELRRLRLQVLHLLLPQAVLGLASPGLLLRALHAHLRGLQRHAQSLRLHLQLRGRLLQLHEVLALGPELLQPLLHALVVVAQAVDLAAQGADALLVDLPQALLVGLVVPAAEVLQVVLVQSAQQVVVPVVTLGVLGVMQAELAGADRLHVLVVDADQDAQPVKHREELWPRVGAADGLQLGPVDLHGIPQPPHDGRHLVLHLAVHLQLWVQLRDEVAEDVEELLRRRVLQELLVRDGLAVALRRQQVHDVAGALRREAAVADGPRVARAPDERAAVDALPHHGAADVGVAHAARRLRRQVLRADRRGAGRLRAEP